MLGFPKAVADIRNLINFSKWFEKDFVEILKKDNKNTVKNIKNITFSGVRTRSK